MKHTIGQHKGALVLFCALAVAALAMFTGGVFAGALNGTPQTLSADGTGGSAVFGGLRATVRRRLGRRHARTGGGPGTETARLGEQSSRAATGPQTPKASAS